MKQELTGPSGRNIELSCFCCKKGGDHRPRLHWVLFAVVSRFEVGDISFSLVQSSVVSGSADVLCGLRSGRNGLPFDFLSVLPSVKPAEFVECSSIPGCTSAIRPTHATPAPATVCLKHQAKIHIRSDSFINSLKATPPHAQRKK